MTLSGRPLLGNRADARLFTGREAELRDIADAMRRELNVLVVGEAGVGKTSLLQALRYKDRAERYTFVGAAGIEDAATLLAAVADAVGADGRGADAVGADGRGVADQLTALAALPPQRIVLDDVRATAGHGLFGQLRDQLWSLGWRWIVAAGTDERAGLRLPPADAFFEYVVDLGPLPAPAASRLLARRLPTWREVSIKSLVAAVGGNPRRLLDAVRAAGADESRVGPVLDALSGRDAAISRAGRPEAMLAAELGRLGAASASDEPLLRRLGWTRSRAVQVLGHLEQLGLVRGEDVRTGRGRPRKVYRLVTPVEFAALREASA